MLKWTQTMHCLQERFPTGGRGDVGTSQMSDNVDFISMVTQQYCNALLAGFSVGRSIRNSPLLCNG
jgi:hypothetical protein